MSGGVAWVFDPQANFEQQVAKGALELTRMSDDHTHPAYPHDADDLKSLLEGHVRFTKSSVAQEILNKWPEVLESFVRVFPIDYKNALNKSDKGVAASDAFKQLLPGGGSVTPAASEAENISPFTFPDIEETG